MLIWTNLYVKLEKPIKMQPVLEWESNPAYSAVIHLTVWTLTENAEFVFVHLKPALRWFWHGFLLVVLFPVRFHNLRVWVSFSFLMMDLMEMQIWVVAPFSSDTKTNKTLCIRNVGRRHALCLNTACWMFRSVWVEV